MAFYSNFPLKSYEKLLNSSAYNRRRTIDIQLSLYHQADDTRTGLQALLQINERLIISTTRNPCYRKDDRTMRRQK